MKLRTDKEVDKEDNLLKAQQKCHHLKAKVYLDYVRLNV